jgi:hypothetical protein
MHDHGDWDQPNGPPSGILTNVGLTALRQLLWESWAMEPLLAELDRNRLGRALLSEQSVRGHA